MVEQLLARLQSAGFWMPYTPDGQLVHVRHPGGGAVVPVSEDPYSAAGLLLHIAKDPAVPDTLGMARWDGKVLGSIVTLAVGRDRSVVAVSAEGDYHLCDPGHPALAGLLGSPVVDVEADVSVWFNTTTRTWMGADRAVSAVR